MGNGVTNNLGPKSGNRMINMTTTNVDTLRTMDSIDSLLTNLQTNNIDIACIQETHNNRNGRKERGGYKFFFRGENGNVESKQVNSKAIRG